MNIEDHIKAILGAMQEQRKEICMTLGKLLSVLKQCDLNDTVEGIRANGDSSRAYYTDFAFEPGTCTVEELISFIINHVIDEKFYGYKGGEYLMDRDTVIHIAEYGYSGEPIVAAYKELSKLIIITGGGE